MSTASVLSRRPVHRGRVLDLGLERIRLPNGVETELEIIRHPGAAAVVPICDDGSVLMIYQYRHAAAGYLWEIPAGTLNPGETPIECAHRELIEEAGMSAGELIELGSTLPVPGYSTERIYLYAARHLAPAAQKFDADELIAEVRAFSPGKIVEMVTDGSIEDAKSTVALCRSHARGLLAPPMGVGGVR